MDVNQARTFLAILETGSFLRAAEKVNVAQSTVSARIKTLEELLGQHLFERNKAGATPTSAGREFTKHATAFVRMWDQAKLAVALPEAQTSLLTVGGQPSLWDGFLLRWLPWMRRNAPEFAIRAQMLTSSNALMQQLVDGTLDIAVLYRPEARPGIVIRQIFEEQLVLVSSVPASATGKSGNYIYIDWGPEFQADHALNFPNMEVPSMSLNLGTLGISLLLENRASGYFPFRIAKPYMEKGTLRIKKDAPSFTYPVYAAFPESCDQMAIEKALKGLTRIATTEQTAP